MKYSVRGIQKLLIIACFYPGLICQAGSVRMLNGDTYEGKVTADGAGISVTPEHSATIKLELANVFDAVLTEHDDSKSDSLPPGTFPPGALLTNGSFLCGTVATLDAPTVKLGPASKPFTVPTSSIATIVFAPIPHAPIDQPRGGKTGAILPTGDFFVGSFLGMKENKVVINSVLFGPHPFNRGSQIAGVVLRDTQTTARYEFTTVDGSRFLANEIQNNGGIIISDSILGQVKINSTDIAEIHAGSACYQRVTDLKPLSSPTSVRQEPQGTLVTAVNVPVTYPVVAGMNGFSCDIAVAKNAPPGARVIFAVYCDGKSVLRSLPVDSTTAPQSFHVNFGAARNITLRVEPVAPGSDKVEGNWIEPLLVHP